jgi:hypothetical protein
MDASKEGVASVNGRIQSWVAAMSKSKGIIIPREVLLIEIERRCRAPECHRRVRVGLTKEEARLYCGFACERCARHWDDFLSERDVPDWWEELAVTGLASLREKPGTNERDETVETITRLSDAYRSRDEE